MKGDQIHCMDNLVISSAKDNPERIHRLHIHQASKEGESKFHFKQFNSRYFVSVRDLHQFQPVVLEIYFDDRQLICLSEGSL